MHCRCWNCPRCGPKRARQYRRAISDTAERLKLCRFVTLTLDPSKIKGDPVPYLRDCFAKFRVYLRRKYGEAPQYICVLEFQKNGTPHLHILIDRFIEQKWIQNVWQQIGGGMHVDIRRVDVHRVSRYVSKYLTKELLTSAPERSRRVTTSRGIHLLPRRKAEYEWNLLRSHIEVLLRRFAPVARNIRFDQETELIESFIVVGCGPP